MNMIDKVAMIAIIGRANVGKSTLTNMLTGDKVAIVSPKPQTTRNRIFGVFCNGNTQMILLDTPGFHKAKTRLGEYMIGVVKESVADVDVIALIVEPFDNIGVQEEMLIEHISRSGIPSVLVINKIDTIRFDQTLPIIERYSHRYRFDAIVPISARTGDGIPQLLDIFDKYALEGHQLFPDDMTTDQPEKQIIAEIIREKLLLCLDNEIPHGTAVEITKFSERLNEPDGKSNLRVYQPDFRNAAHEVNALEHINDLSKVRINQATDDREDTGGEIIDIDATIICEKKSHKGMIIGKKGAMLKRIGQLAREDIERFMGAKVFLQTWVKVKENWRDSGAMLRDFGYN